MTWNLSASGAVGEAVGEAAAAAEPGVAKMEKGALRDLEHELMTELHKVFSNPKFGVLNTFFNGSHTGTVSNLHQEAPQAPEAAPEPAAAPQPTEAAPQPTEAAPAENAPAAPAS